MQVENNKALVLGFFELCFKAKQPRAAAMRYLGEPYIQHNPQAADGREAFIEIFEGFFAVYPDFSYAIKQVIAEGDRVVLHVHCRNTPTDVGEAVVEIYRIAGDRIVEHWDVVQAVPLTAANRNGMF